MLWPAAASLSIWTFERFQKMFVGQGSCFCEIGWGWVNEFGGEGSQLPPGWGQ